MSTPLLSRNWYFIPVAVCVKELDRLALANFGTVPVADILKVDDSVDNVESSSNQVTEQPADSLAEKDNEHPADHEAGDEHPTDSEHPNN